MNNRQTYLQTKTGFITSLMILAGLLTVSLLSAETLTLTLGHNDVVYDGDVGTGEWYGGPDFEAETMRSKMRRWSRYAVSLIKFDLGGLPADQFIEVESATLKLTAESITSDGDGMHHVTRFGGLDDPHSGNPIPWNTDATFTTYDGTNDWPRNWFSWAPDQPWFAQASNEEEDGYCEETMSSIDLSGYMDGDTLEWDITKIVNDWLYNDVLNSGLLVAPRKTRWAGSPEEADTQLILYTSRAGDTTKTPQLVVTLIPEPSTFVLLGFAGLFLTRRKRMVI